MVHYSVLLKECIDNLNIQPDGIYVDGTLGRAGHSIEIAKKLNNGTLYGFDKDQTALEQSRIVLKDVIDKCILIHSDFSKIKEKLLEKGIDQVDGILLDIGVSSPQFDDAARGFSYRFDARLDMRMDQSQDLSAYEVVNTYSYHDLVRIFFQYGEEKFSKQIARKIEKAREDKPITTTFELVDIIKSALPSKILNKKGHPAKQVFQALRIEVNDELNALKEVIAKAIELLAVDGRLCIITFHSLEDRIVKEMFNSYCKEESVDKRIPLLPSEIKQADYKLVNKKPIIASKEELEENNRSHSAKLRVIERVRR